METFKKVNKNEVIRIRVTKEQKNKIMEIATSKEIKVSEYILSLIDKDIKESN